MYTYFTNGEKTIKLKDGLSIPEGFYKGRTFKVNPWNKGLTKESDERVKRNGLLTKNTRIKNGSYDNPWNKGLTKDTSDSLKRVSEKVSNYRKGKPAWNIGIKRTEEQNIKLSESMKGHIPWNKGLNKNNNSSIMQISLKLNGHKSFVKDWDIAKLKEYVTKNRNHTFNTSKEEDKLFMFLNNLYGEENVLRQYFDKDRYPFNCDFYIKSEDLFIEYNGTWFHGGHPFDENNLNDLNILENLKTKVSDTKKSYEYCIYIWTIRDVLKLNTFITNNLNYMIIYPNSDIILTNIDLNDKLRELLENLGIDAENNIETISSQAA